MTTMVLVYLGYLVICVIVITFVAQTLREHGTVFMAHKGIDPSPLIKAKTHLLVVGFYLVNFGLMGLALKYGGGATNAETAIEVLSTKIGAIIFMIGFMHFTMIGLFAWSRNEPTPTDDVVILKPATSDLN